MRKDTGGTPLAATSSPIPHLPTHAPTLAQDWGILGTFWGAFPPQTHLPRLAGGEQWSEDRGKGRPQTSGRALVKHAWPLWVAGATHPSSPLHGCPPTWPLQGREGQGAPSGFAQPLGFCQFEVCSHLLCEEKLSGGRGA